MILIFILLMLMYTRTIEKNLIWQCFQSKVIILYGPRQVGKTTLTKQISAYFSEKKILFINWDDIEVQQLWQASQKVIDSLIVSYDIIIFDEAQRIKNIWLILKIIVDNYPMKQCIATGSSSFDLAHSITEPLTGRAYIHYLYPLSLEELYGQTPLSQIVLEERMMYGAYPVLFEWSISSSVYLKSLFDNYLYKDILMFEGIKKHALIIKLIQALALQIWNEVSYQELAVLLWSNKDTIAKYMMILEQAFIIKTLSPFHTNQRKEIKAHKKVYFWDLWVRNAAINNFNPLSMRNDVGQLWENLVFIERTKYIQYHSILHNQYFWRETAGAEIDYIEQYGDYYDCREFKYSPKKWWSLPVWFSKKYPHHSFDVIRTDTIGPFVR